MALSLLPSSSSVLLSSGASSRICYSTQHVPIHSVIDDVLVYILSHLTESELILFTHVDATLRRRVLGLAVFWLEISLNSVAQGSINRFFAFLERSQGAGIRLRVDIRHRTAAAIKVLLPALSSHIGHTRSLHLKVPLQYQPQTLAALCAAETPLLEEASIQFYNDSFFVTNTTSSSLFAELPLWLFCGAAPHLRTLRLDNLCLPLEQIPALLGVRDLVYAYDSDSGLDARVLGVRLPALTSLSIVVGHVQPGAENIVPGPALARLQRLAVYFKPDLSTPATHEMLLAALSHRSIPHVALHGFHSFRTIDLETFINPHVDGLPLGPTHAAVSVTRSTPTDVSFMSVFGKMEEGFCVALESPDTGRTRSVTSWLGVPFAAHRVEQPYDAFARRAVQLCCHELSTHIVALTVSMHERFAWETLVEACDRSTATKCAAFGYVRHLVLLWERPPLPTMEGGPLMPSGRVDMRSLREVVVRAGNKAIDELRPREFEIWDLVRRLGATDGTPILQFDTVRRG